LDILEYCDISTVIEREQYYLDKLKPEYNILKIAGSRLGCKHSSETIINIKLAIKDRTPSPLRRINHLLATGHITTVINKKDNSIKVYDSIRAV
jgi:group I intron endonuclease